jgi:cytochrome c oxidase subunit 2
MLQPHDAVASPWGARSPEARAIADLFTQTLGICAVIFVLVAGLVGYCILKYRAKDGAAEPSQTEGHKRLEIGWTLGPLAIVIVLFLLTARTMASTDPPAAADRPADVTIVGHQWWWEARYPSGAVTANEIHIPVGKAWLVRLEAADVIHDFWVPALARKIDATPGHAVNFWIQADTPGRYGGTCAEYCGAQHAWMRIVVVADAPADFEAWEKGESAVAAAPASDAAARGAALFDSRTCKDCHAIERTAGAARPSVAPDLTHLASRKTLAAGLLENTPESLGRWLKDPQALKPGSHMPSLQLTDGEVSDLVAYFGGLK